ncbi:uncharacterized protein K460DRAFT_157415 [Cucurbitaria berberidis CBS 394.84]|uniref:Uncharacterized protein n=1 Tax=Cucurbitaria berberidis CBS 394.84 TaxID=1168544 RepID=A0A9P4L6R3_9PLEO|nr:uncharacterized protein K460DRAFT_157415 [Cucurbitaria berberidis CBS 394.84]KAF1844085.1 hypothetical protein K460DRAFT_157415 [Cucurbitaria berberidis CBS 394.84]
MADMEDDFLFDSKDYDNSVSTFLLNSTAFSDVNMDLIARFNSKKGRIGTKTLAPQDNDTVLTKDRRCGRLVYKPAVAVESGESSRTTDKNDIYTTVADYVITPQLAYFHVNVPLFDSGVVNFDKIGILYEFLNGFYIVYESLQPQTGRPTIHRAWMPQSGVGSYLKAEWLSLPKIQVGPYGAGVPTSDGWWNVHSTTIQYLRLSCLMKAQEIELEVCKAKEEKRQEVNLRRCVDVLGVQFGRIIDALYGTRRVQEAEAAKATEKFMEEFMDFDF